MFFNVNVQPVPPVNLLQKELRRLIGDIFLVAGQVFVCAGQGDAGSILPGNGEYIKNAYRLEDAFDTVIAVLPLAHHVQGQIDLCRGSYLDFFHVCSPFLDARKASIRSSAIIRCLRE